MLVVTVSGLLLMLMFLTLLVLVSHMAAHRCHRGNLACSGRILHQRLSFLVIIIWMQKSCCNLAIRVVRIPVLAQTVQPIFYLHDFLL